MAGKHALVTGGGAGIGRAIAHALAGTGMHVTISGRREAVLEDAARGYDNISGIVADVTDEAAMVALHKRAEGDHGIVDIVIANAGVAGSAPAHRTLLSDWQHMIDVNLTGAFLSVKPALEGMIARKSGRIVFVASVAGLKGYAYAAPYVAAKHGVVGLMRALAVETAKSGVTVNAVCPGYTESDMLAEAIDRIVQKTGRTPDEARQHLSAGNPQARIIKPLEVANAVLWLCSEGAASVTGQAISISGGETW